MFPPAVCALRSAVCPWPCLFFFVIYTISQFFFFLLLLLCDTSDYGCCRGQVSGLLLSTPVETVPILVTYSAVSGGIFFHAPPLDPPSASPLPRDRYQPEAVKAAAAAAGSRHDTQDGCIAAEEGRQQTAEDVQGQGAAAWVDEEEGEKEAEVAVFLENAFPGKLIAAPVSLRSTAPWEGRVEGMESSGPLVRATLTRRVVPGVMAGGGYSPGADSGVVEVRV